MLHLSVAHYSFHKTNTHRIEQYIAMFQKYVSTIQAHEWMNDAHVHGMQVQSCKPNTRGVIALPPYKNLILRFGLRTFCYKILHKLFVDTLLFPKLHLPHHDDPTVSCMFSPHYSE